MNVVLIKSDYALREGRGVPEMMVPHMERDIPKIIWIVWLQGWGSAPEIVRACLRTWQKHNDRWDIRALSMTDVRGFLESDNLLSVVAPKNIPRDALSDVIRIALLRKYGGIWIDSTCYSLMPLDKWLPDNLGTGFFAFDKPGPDRMISSWFLASTKNNYIIEKWYDLTVDYWISHESRDHYYWFHYLFADGYHASSKFRAIWDNASKFSADGPHYYVPYERTLFRPATADDQSILDHPRFPLLKLTHKVPSEIPPADSVLNYLFKRAMADGNAIQFPLSKVEWLCRRAKYFMKPAYWIRGRLQQMCKG